MKNRQCFIVKAIITAIIMASAPVVATAHEGQHDAQVEQTKPRWNCPSCGHKGNTGNFCSNCGAKRPDPWKCPKCGKADNYNNFCSNCGTQKPEPAAPKAQTPAPSPRPTVGGPTLNVILTDGKVDQYTNSPEVSFSGSQLRVGGTRYDLSKVQRLQYGSKVSGVKNNAGFKADEPKAIYIYRNDGDFEALAQKRVQRIYQDKADSLKIATADSLYAFPILAIDSIGIHQFETVYNSRVVDLTPYEPYLEAVSVEAQTIRFSKNLPADMKPKVGDILWRETITTAFPDGYAGRVKTTDGYSCTTEIVGFDDVYERVVMFSEFAPTQEELAAAGFTKKAAPANAAALTAAPPPEGAGMSLDLSNMKLGVSIGGVSASLQVDLDPIFKVAFEKRESDEKTITKIDVGLSTKSTIEVSVEGGGHADNHKGPSLTPMAKFVIPACPVFSIGIDLYPYITASIKGKVTVDAFVSTDAKASMTYCDGDVTFVPSLKFDCGGGVPKAQAEGSVLVGLSILPSIQATGGMCKLGPILNVGPTATVTLEVDAAGAVTGKYDAIKDSKLTLGIGGDFTATLYFLGKEVRPSMLTELPFSKNILDVYFLPLFTKPGVGPARKENVGVSTTVSRTLLFPVSVGLEIEQGGSSIKYYNHGTYSGGNDMMRAHFSGFEEEVTYTAVPTVDIFDFHLKASPVTDFTIAKEDEEEEPPQEQNDLERPESPMVQQDFKAPGGYLFEWKNSKGDHGYFERKNNVFYSYQNIDGNGILYRYNEKEETFAQKYDRYDNWWVEDDIYGDGENSMIRSHELYKEYDEARVNLIAESNDLWNVFTDDLGGLAYFEETFRRHYMQTFGAKNGADWLKKDYVGTGTICGIKCNIYDNHKRWPQQAKVWVDPKTGLCLRYELDGGQTWFEVTKYEFHDFDIKNL